MPAVSKTQQRLMGQAHGVRKFLDTNGKEGLNPRKIDSGYRETIVEIDKNMKKKALKDYASTKHANLPEEVEDVEEGIATIIPHLSPESNKPKKSKARKMQNLSDYREFVTKIKK